MGITKKIGNNSIASGNKMKVELHSYERSTHDLSYIWRSSLSAGTLVPFLSNIALNGDTFDIELQMEVNTQPTVGALFGSFALEAHIYQTPIRLYHKMLQNNMVNVGLHMEQVKLPQLLMYAKDIDRTKNPNNQQINPSSIYAYLGIRGLGRWDEEGITADVERQFNATPLLIYYDICKNYYWNKQEEIGAVIHSLGTPAIITGMFLYEANGDIVGEIFTTGTNQYLLGNGRYIRIQYTGTLNNAQIELGVQGQNYTMMDVFQYSTDIGAGDRLITGLFVAWENTTLYSYYVLEDIQPIESQPQIATFPLSNIDDMRDLIYAQPKTNPLIIDYTDIAPYGLGLLGTAGFYSKMYSQEGLALKTYKADKFNNWIQTDWIDGPGGINQMTAVDTSAGNFQIAAMILGKKMYDVANRIAISGGSYDDWQETAYTPKKARSTNTPVFEGGLSKEVVFQQVVSTSETIQGGESQPLGSLAGRGGLGKKHHGGKIIVKIDEPSYITGIVSLTPRIDYSQGNTFDVNIKTMRDLHIPGLDQIGYQDLVTDLMATWDTMIDPATKTVTFQSAGKQPAWIDYTTDVNRCYGNFAIENMEMYMTLNRNYEMNTNGAIKDLTSYIDPVKYNQAFAYTKRDAQNFQLQIAVKMIARRMMSAKMQPNL